MIKGIFFDVGGTLYSYGNLPVMMATLMQNLAERLGHDVEDVTRHYMLANKEIDRQFADKPAYLFRDYFEVIFGNLLQRIDKPHLHSHFEWFEEHQRENLMGCMDLKPDCHETLSRLKDIGLYLSAVSNADENMLTPLVERGQLHRWLTHWTSSEAARSCKPDQRFFRIALAKSGLDPDEVVFVGDSLEQDILGAHRAGMTTVLISETDGPAPMHIGRDTPEPHHRITELSALPGIIESIRAGKR